MSAASLAERVLAATRAEPSPTRAVLRARLAARIGAATAAALAIFFALGGVRVGGRPASLMLTTALGAALLAAAVGVIGLGRGRSMVGRRASLLIAVVFATPLVLLAWKIGWSWRYHMMAPWPSRFGLRCLSLSLAIGCAPLLALVASRRRAHPLHATENGAAIGAAVASMTWVLVDLWCPVADLRHLLVGHVLPFCAFIACGAVAGRRLLALR